MIARKAFNKELYQQYDELAKKKTTEHLQSLGCQVVPHPNRYAQDLMAKTEMNKFMVECEIKIVWKTDDFPYETVQLPERKSKFFASPTLFFIWNKTLSSAIMFKSDDIKHLTPVEVSNKYITSGEFFYQIPLDMTGTVRMGRYETNT